MSFPTTNPLPPDAPLPVFVDESGRRRARTRIVARSLVAVAGVYVVIVVVGLTGSVDLPGVHLGELDRSAPGRAARSPLGKGSKVLSLPGALTPRVADGAATPAANRTPTDSGAVPGGISPAPAQPDGASPAPNGNTPTTGRRATPTTATTNPSSPTTTLPVTTTTRRRGAPTTTPHGPTTTIKPGQGKGRTRV